MHARPRRVLLIRFSSLGDVVLTQPVVAALAAAAPGAEVVYLTRAAYRPLLEGQPGIARVAVLEGAPPGAAGPGRLCRSLGRFDLAIDLHGTLRSRLCLRAADAARKVSWRKNALLRRLWAAGWMRGRMERETRHVIDRYLDTLRTAGIAAPAAAPRLVPGPAGARAAAEALRAAGVPAGAGFAVVVPGARWPNKRWTAAGFAAVAAVLREREGLVPVLAGDAADREQVAAVAALIPGGAPSVAGALDLAALAALLASARVVVANDSGPAHLAAAVGTPVVALFGPTHEAFGFAPRGERVRVVGRDLACRPCSVHGGRRCPRGRRACLDDIRPEEVLAAVRSVLRER